MAEEIENAGNQGGEGEAGNGFKPVTTQEDLNRIVGERVARTKAQFGDYDDLKTKAARLDEIEQANKSEAEKAAERIAALEQDLTTAQSTALRARIQAKFQIADEDADLFLTATDEDTLTKQAQRLAERVADRKKTGNHAPLQGRAPSEPGTSSSWETVLSELDRQRQN